MATSKSATRRKNKRNDAFLMELKRRREVMEYHEAMEEYYYGTTEDTSS